MNCYFCARQAEPAVQPALGICRACGAGICGRHLVLVVTPGVMGMAGMTPARRHLVCSGCYETVGQPSQRADAPPRRKAPGRWSLSIWWRRFTKHPLSALPEPEEAIGLVERFLKQAREQKESEG